MAKKSLIQKDKFSVVNFIGLLVAGIVNAVGAILLLFPVSIYDSGMSGLSMLLDQVTPNFLTVSMFLIVLDFPIFFYGLKKQGVVFTVYSLFAVAIYSITAFVFTKFVLPNASGSPIAGSELILCAVFGGIVSGIGSGLTIKFGGAMDGLDVLAVLFHKKLNLSIGNFTLIFNTLLYIVAGLLNAFVLKGAEFGWILPLYSIIAYFCGSKTIDFITEGINRSKCALIITNKAQEISEALSKNFDGSGTIVDAIGGYSKSQKQMIYFNVNHFELNKLKRIVYSIDETAYITLQDVSDIIKARK